MKREKKKERTENLFLRGSEWRKWDLHLHAPGTKINDQYTTNTLDLFCASLEKSDVQAFGITDYFSADTYFEVKKRFKEKYPSSEKVFFPNVELRTSYVVNSAKEEVNLHLIFNPDHEDKIKTFLDRLLTTETVDDGLEVYASEIADYQAATTDRKSIEKALRATFGKSVDLTEYVLIFTSVI